jgi:hypothetical protein
MTDCVDALMNAVKSPQREAAFDRSAPDPQLEELPVCDNAVLSGREPRHHQVTWPI